MLFRPFFIRWLDRLKGTKNFEERSIVCDSAHEEKMIFLAFTQNGCYINQQARIQDFEMGGEFL